MAVQQCCVFPIACSGPPTFRRLNSTLHASTSSELARFTIRSIILRFDISMARHGSDCALLSVVGAVASWICRSGVENAAEAVKHAEALAHPFTLAYTIAMRGA
jgi:hypothetical protein